MTSEESLRQINLLIGEHFSQFALVVVDYDDEMYFDYSSQHTAQALFKQAEEQFDDPIYWDDIEEIDEGDSWKHE